MELLAEGYSIDTAKYDQPYFPTPISIIALEQPHRHLFRRPLIVKLPANLTRQYQSIDSVTLNKNVCS